MRSKKYTEILSSSLLRILILIVNLVADNQGSFLYHTSPGLLLGASQYVMRTADTDVVANMEMEGTDCVEEIQLSILVGLKLED